MRRSEYEYVTVTGAKGINQQEKLANPEAELYDARNLWAPDGNVQKRPGTYGVGHIINELVSNGSVAGTYTFLKESPVGVFSTTTTLSSLPVGGRWYFGFDDLSGTTGYPTGLEFSTTATNSNISYFLVEYWNGDTWVRLDAVEANGSSAPTYITVTNALENAGGTAYFFVWPPDLTLKLINGTTAYWFRFSVMENALDSSVSLDGTFAIVLNNTGFDSDSRAIIAAGLPNTTKFITFCSSPASTASYFSNSSSLRGPANTNESRRIDTSTTADFFTSIDEAPSYTVVPEFDEIYVSINYKTSVHKGTVASTTDCVDVAQVETDPLFVGSGAKYDPVYVEQLTTWPRARYIAYHRGEMWAANLLDEGVQSIRWSAGTSINNPGYKIWPLLSIETAIDPKGHPITAIFPFDHDMLVFKPESIYRMTYTGLDALDLNTYRAEKIVAGVGCVAHQSIQDIKGQLIFLGLDGIYVFDGQRANKISDRIQKYINSIVPGRRAFATSAHWPSKSLYLLAITTNGSNINNLVLVYDYKNDAWWVWDGIEAISMFTAEDAADVDHVYFMDNGGRVFELGPGTNDNGGTITAYGITHRLSQDNVTQKCRSVVALATNVSRSLNIEVQPNDKPFTGTVTPSLSFTDSAEKEYGTATMINGSTFGATGDTYTVDRERFIGASENVLGEWFRVKFIHAQKYAPLHLSELKVGIIPESVRR